jgi:nucleotide-binding universal stress UspA family protein
MKCPVCEEMVEDQRDFCPYCGWELSLDSGDLSPERKASYKERLKIARENWRLLQEYRRFERESLEAPEFQRKVLEAEKIHKKILFCTDLYPSSDYAFAAALDLAERSGAEFIILHVLGSPHRYSGQITTAEGETWASEEVYEKIKERLKEYYFCRIEQENPDWVRVAVKGGTPWIEILRFARKEKVDLIVMGPYTIHDPRLGMDLEKPHLGKHAQRVILQANCPVYIVTSPKQRLSFQDEGIKPT